MPASVFGVYRACALFQPDGATSMKTLPLLFAAAALAAPFAHAADAAAGKAKVDVVCAACHGANGVSVADAIPNLAGQKAA